MPQVFHVPMTPRRNRRPHPLPDDRLSMRSRMLRPSSRRASCQPRTKAKNNSSPCPPMARHLMRTELRIVAGALRGRKLHCKVGSYLRPTPQRVREALFSILGDAVPDRLFVDVFAGTGVIGLEALSRG